MAFVLLIVGAVLLASSIQNTQSTLFTLAQGDLLNSGNGGGFIEWFAAIFLIGAIGYIPKLKSISVAFLTLVIIVLALKAGNPSGTGGGFFAQLSSALQGATTSQAAAAQAAQPTVSTPASQSIISPIPALNLPNLLGSTNNG